MIRFQREMMFPGALGRHNHGQRLDVDIRESDDDYRFSLEIPGVVKEDIKLWLENNILTVSGEKKEIEADSARKIYSERSYGKFERSFRLPRDIDGNNVKAEFVNGILEVSVAKSEKAKPVNVEIK